eukprot:scaffold86659_cov45-Phaeocystis_antarctica.AAC.4
MCPVGWYRPPEQQGPSEGSAVEGRRAAAHGDHGGMREGRSVRAEGRSVRAGGGEPARSTGGYALRLAAGWSSGSGEGGSVLAVLSAETETQAEPQSEAATPEAATPEAATE